MKLDEHSALPRTTRKLQQRREAMRLAGDPGSTDEERVEYRARYLEAYHRLIATDDAEQLAGLELMFVDAWNQHVVEKAEDAERERVQQEDEHKRQVAIHLEVARTLRDEGKDDQPAAQGVLPSDQPLEQQTADSEVQGDGRTTDDILREVLTQPQWCIVKALRDSKHRVRFSTLKEIPGAFRKEGGTTDRAVESQFEQINGRLADTRMEIKTQTMMDDPTKNNRWAWFVDKRAQKTTRNIPG